MHHHLGNYRDFIGDRVGRGQKKFGNTALERIAALSHARDRAVGLSQDREPT